LKAERWTFSLQGLRREKESSLWGDQLAQESLDAHVGVGPFLFRDAPFAPPDFADDLEFVARDALERGDDIWMGAVKIGEVE